MHEILHITFQQFVVWSPRIIAAILILVAFWILARVSKSLVTKAGKHSKLNNQIVRMGSQSAYIVLILLGCTSALAALGVDVSAIVAGLGLSGFALGFALKDTISNFLAGLMLLLYRPFQVNDHITVGAFSGNVIAIDLRYTSLVHHEKLILIPNAFMFKQPITIDVNSKP